MEPETTAARLLAALERQDADGVAATLGRWVRLLHDAGDEGGGEVRGRERVAEELLGIRMRVAGAVVQPARVNGEAGGVIRAPDGRPVAVLAVGRGRRIQELWVTTAADKLAHWQP